MKPNAYRVLEEAVDRGALRGWHRAFKYTDEPTKEQAVATIAECVLNEIGEWFDFDQSEQIVRPRAQSEDIWPIEGKP